jgi:hypothetical protein
VTAEDQRFLPTLAKTAFLGGSIGLENPVLIAREPVVSFIQTKNFGHDISVRHFR